MIKKMALCGAIALGLSSTSATANMFDGDTLVTLKHIDMSESVGGGFELHLPVSKQWFIDFDAALTNPELSMSTKQMGASFEVGYKSERRHGFLYNYYIKAGQFVSQVEDGNAKVKDEQFGGEVGVNARINQFIAYDVFAGKDFNGFAGVNIHLSLSSHVNLTMGYRTPTERRDELNDMITAGFMFNF